MTSVEDSIDASKSKNANNPGTSQEEDSKVNLIKKLIGLSLFQAAVFLLYITIGEVEGATAPIFSDGGNTTFSNPLPQVLILTAIVVGISTLALGLGIVVRIKEEYGSIEENEIQEIDRR